MLANRTEGLVVGNMLTRRKSNVVVNRLIRRLYRLIESQEVRGQLGLLLTKRERSYQVMESALWCELARCESKFKI
jgi:hypothetical protein